MDTRVDFWCGLLERQFAGGEVSAVGYAGVGSPWVAPTCLGLPCAVMGACLVICLWFGPSRREGLWIRADQAGVNNASVCPWFLLLVPGRGLVSLGIHGCLSPGCGRMWGLVFV